MATLRPPPRHALHDPSWSRFRAETARAILARFADVDEAPEVLADRALKRADALVQQLKKETP